MQIPIKRHAIPVFPERQRPHVKELNDLPFPRKRVSFEKKSLRFFYFRCVCVGGGGGRYSLGPRRSKTPGAKLFGTETSYQAKC